MASSGNFGVWNPLNVGSGGSTSLTVGNTNAVMTGADPRTTGTVGGVISDTDGYYFETVATSTGSGALTLGIVNEDRHNQCMAGQIHSRSGSFMWRGYDGGVFFVETSSNTSYGTFADGDVIGWFVKNSKLYVKKNNSDVVGDVVNTSAGIDISGGFFFPAVSRTVGGGAQTSSILRTDSDDWSYSPPEGFKGLTSKDMLISSDIDPAQTDDDYPSKQFGVVTYTGNSSTNAVTGLNLQPDLLWVKKRSATGTNYLSDTSRGINKFLFSNGTDAEQTGGGYASIYSAFGTDGFTLGSSATGPNDSGATYVAWGWRANGGTTSSNGNGSITSTVQANTKAGFSIATYTSPGSGTNHTVGHGLSGVDFVITKNRDATFNWYCFHKSSPDKTYRLNSGSEHSYANWSMGATTWGSENGYTHDGTSNFVAYAWQNVEGMQKFGSYTGNGNADGPFVYTGFRPRLIFTLLTNSTSGWRVRDTARDTYNPSDTIVWWNRSDQEYNSSGYNFDILSNGFKVRNTGSDFNTNGSTYLYGAWGDVPFKYNNTF
jgi:hypothetical protein